MLETERNKKITAAEFKLIDNFSLFARFQQKLQWEKYTRSGSFCIGNGITWWKSSLSENCRQENGQMGNRHQKTAKLCLSKTQRPKLIRKRKGQQDIEAETEKAKKSPKTVEEQNKDAWAFALIQWWLKFNHSSKLKVKATIFSRHVFALNTLKTQTHVIFNELNFISRN